MRAYPGHAAPHRRASLLESRRHGNRQPLCGHLAAHHIPKPALAPLVYRAHKGRAGGNVGVGGFRECGVTGEGWGEGLVAVAAVRVGEKRRVHIESAQVRCLQGEGKRRGAGSVLGASVSWHEHGVANRAG